jgi:hypothetical protein
MFQGQGYNLRQKAKSEKEELKLPSAKNPDNDPFRLIREVLMSQVTVFYVVSFFYFLPRYDFIQILNHDRNVEILNQFNVAA